MNSKGSIRLFLLASFVCAPALRGQDNTELLNRMKAMEDRIKALEAEVQSLRGQPPAAPAAAVNPPAAMPPAAPAAIPPEQLAGQGATPQLGGAGGAAAKVLNPDISVIGNFIGAAGNPQNRPTPSLEMHESEVGFQEVIDPYARADFFLSFGEQGVSLEEGYLTFTALPVRLAGEGREDAGRVRQSEHAA